MRWDTDWESVVVDPADPDLALMFKEAIVERLGNYTTPRIDTGQDALAFWIDAQRRVMQMYDYFIPPGDYDGKPLYTYKQQGYTWPPTDERIGLLTPGKLVFKRKRPLEIYQLADNGPAYYSKQDGDIARFVANSTESEHPTTATAERVYSGRKFRLTSGSWVETAEYSVPNIYNLRGPLKRGDYWGGHFLNDLKDCINASLWLKVDINNWSNNLENNLKGGEGFVVHIDPNQSVTTQVAQPIFIATMDASKDVAMGDFLIQPTVKEWTPPGFSGMIVAASESNRHGAGTIRITNRVNGAFKAPGSNTFGASKYLNPNQEVILENYGKTVTVLAGGPIPDGDYPLGFSFDVTGPPISQSRSFAHRIPNPAGGVFPGDVTDGFIPSFSARFAYPYMSGDYPINYAFEMFVGGQPPDATDTVFDSNSTGIPQLPIVKSIAKFPNKQPEFYGPKVGNLDLPHRFEGGTGARGVVASAYGLIKFDVDGGYKYRRTG